MDWQVALPSKQHIACMPEVAGKSTDFNTWSRSLPCLYILRAISALDVDAKEGKVLLYKTKKPLSCSDLNICVGHHSTHASYCSCAQLHALAFLKVICFSGEQLAWWRLWPVQRCCIIPPCRHTAWSIFLHMILGPTEALHT